MKPHISFSGGLWWVRPRKGALYGCAAGYLADAWYSWKKNSWLMDALGENREFAN